MLRRILFFPFSLIWGLVLWLRHALYNAGILRSVRPSVPTIVIGNLSFGGTGKTPHVRLVVEALKDMGVIATLSRGYGGEEKDVVEVREESGSVDVGDEPLMLKRALPRLRVFVGADRVKAIEEIQRIIPELKAVILDDAFQHRRLNAGLNMLLTTWAKPYCDDALVPAGYLRDLKGRAGAAQAVVVTKCRGPIDQQAWRKRLELRTDQALFFSGLEHGAPYAVNGPSEVPIGPGMKALLVTGIADPEPLVQHARTVWGVVKHMGFRDHHPFTPADVERLAGTYATFAGPENRAFIVTTEKDAVRLLPLLKGSKLERIPIAVMPVKAVILNDPDGFIDLLRRHLAADTAHR